MTPDTEETWLTWQKMLDTPEPLKMACVASNLMQICMQLPRSSHGSNQIEAMWTYKANLPNPIHRPEFFFDKATFQTNVNFEFYKVDVHA